MSTVKQASLFGNNHAVVNEGGGGSTGPVLALGAVAAGIAFAVVLATAVAAAASLMLIVIGSTAAGCLVVGTITHCALRVAYFRRTGSLPPPRTQSAVLPWRRENPQIEPAAAVPANQYIVPTNQYARGTPPMPYTPAAPDNPSSRAQGRAGQATGGAGCAGAVWCTDSPREARPAALAVKGADRSFGARGSARAQARVTGSTGSAPNHLQTLIP